MSSDWQVVGQRDGEQGVDPQWQFQRHISACEKVKITPDHTLWSHGYQQGLVRFCTPVKGLVVGQEGKAYNNVCPAETEPGFMRGYLLGKKENTLRSRISFLETSINTLDREIDGLVDKATEAKSKNRSVLREEIREKRYQQDNHRREKEDRVYELSYIESLVQQFLADPSMQYDPARL